MIFDLIARTESSSSPPPPVYTSSALITGQNAGASSVEAFHFTSAGMGAKYTTPAVTPTNNVVDVLFAPDNSAVFFVNSSSGTPLYGYPWSTAGGFGTRFTDMSPGMSVGAGQCGAITPDGKAVIVGGGSTPFIRAIPVSSSGYGTAFANPSVLPSALLRNIAVNKSGNRVAITQNNTEAASYVFDSTTGFGAKQVASTPLLANGLSIAISPAEDSIFFATNGGDFIEAYHWSNATGIGAKYASLSNRPTSAPTALAFSADGTRLFMAVGSNIQVRSWDAATGSMSGVLQTVAGGTTMRRIVFSADQQFMAVGYANISPFVNVWPWNGSTLGTALPAAPNPAQTAVAALAFSPQ
jgi:WD40 repeat protein